MFDNNEVCDNFRIIEIYDNVGNFKIAREQQTNYPFENHPPSVPPLLQKSPRSLRAFRLRFFVKVENTNLAKYLLTGSISVKATAVELISIVNHSSIKQFLNNKVISKNHQVQYYKIGNERFPFKFAILVSTT